MMHCEKYTAISEDHGFCGQHDKHVFRDELCGLCHDVFEIILKNDCHQLIHIHFIKDQPIPFSKALASIEPFKSIQSFIPRYFKDTIPTALEKPWDRTVTISDQEILPEGASKGTTLIWKRNAVIVTTPDQTKFRSIEIPYPIKFRAYVSGNVKRIKPIKKDLENDKFTNLSDPAETKKTKRNKKKRIKKVESPKPEAPKPAEAPKPEAPKPAVKQEKPKPLKPAKQLPRKEKKIGNGGLDAFF